MTAAGRVDRTRAADVLCAAAYDVWGGPTVGMALVAVGGYGRGELAPYSDLDVVLVHEDRDEGEWAETLWYPLWDAGVRLDHSVRPGQMDQAAAADLRVALGLLDVRHLAGDPNLTLRLRTAVLALAPRRPDRLPRCASWSRPRHGRVGEIAHASVPDLKEAAGGLRDATVLKALVATWLVDVPHVDLERCRLALLDVRDVLQTSPDGPPTGSPRSSGRRSPPVWCSPTTRAAQTARPRGSGAGSPTCHGSPGAGSRRCSPGRPRPAAAARG